jgi:hypothetical protein
MPRQSSLVLNDFATRATLKQAWQDSLPATTGGHEEGGFILQDSEGNMNVVRWPKGLQNSIVLPQHRKCKFGEKDIIATFHTHPNTSADFLQEPSETDKRAVRDDPDLKGELYEGELVISEQTIYLISPDGQVNKIGYTKEILGE